MYLSPSPLRNSIFVSNRLTNANNLSQISSPSENSIYYKVNQSNSLLSQNFPPVTSPIQNTSLNTSTSRFIQPPLLDSFNTQSPINSPLNLVPSGSTITKNSYEPTHRCTTCGHVHTCNDCKQISNLQQVIDPPEKKIHEPIIINTAKAMGRMNRRMANGPYFRPERSRNVLISQDEILHRTMADPNLNFADIVNQVAKEKEQEQEIAMITGNYPYHQNEYQQTVLSSQNDGQSVQDLQPIFSTDVSGTSVLLQGSTSSQPSQEQLLNSNATILTTPDVTIICNEQSSPTLSPIIRDSKLVDNSLGYKKAIVQYALPRKNVVAAKPRPNPVTPTIKVSNNGDKLKNLKDYLNKLWVW
ncbi:13831_t:CDS:2 [Funneliformis geosporum]|uniref:17002_t:CDS:1 n=1 Tax=Funneliformis geosporum TaxID=1117311 RepID=A0A9W4X1J5_9GLOM|nr:13831_t:CDS:2 [Funneliformis geosporum]CAI2179604.1 17002_t:CDS:2 [Funneliformis geosporum]